MVTDWIPQECSVECVDQVLCDGAKEAHRHLVGDKKDPKLGLASPNHTANLSGPVLGCMEADFFEGSQTRCLGKPRKEKENTRQKEKAKWENKKLTGRPPWHPWGLRRRTKPLAPLGAAVRDRCKLAGTTLLTHLV